MQYANNSVLSSMEDVSRDLLNDSTLSDDMLQEALRTMSMDGDNRNSDSRSSFIGKVSEFRESSKRQTRTGEHDQDSGGGAHHHADTPSQNTAPIKQSSKPNYTQGPYELLYREQYAMKVKRWLHQGKFQHPKEFQDYRFLSIPEKEREQERLAKLLGRLRIQGDALLDEVDQTPHRTNLSPGNKSAWPALGEEMSHDVDEGQTSSSAILLNDTEGDSHQEWFDSQRDPSAVLFSPPLQGSKTPLSSVRLSGRTKQLSRSLSIEQPRALAKTYSPAAAQRKRMASMSGKKGADLVRIRMEATSYNEAQSQDFMPWDDGSTQTFESPINGLSPIKPNLFSSQSPISGSGSNNSEHTPLIPLESDDDMSSADVISTTSTDSITETRWEKSQMDRRPLLDTKRYNITLKNGALYHYDPLITTRDATLHNSDSSDPLSKYGGSSGQRLKEVFTCLSRRDSSADAVAIILSLTEQQIQDVSLKLLVSIPPKHSPPTCLDSQRAMDSPMKEGQTLIILRSKESVAEWSNALRESFPFSVLDFLSLPVKQRKSSSTASKLSSYGAVLATFDVLRAPDITHTIDDNGHVINQKLDDDEGWFESRGPSQKSKQTKQFSVLHLLSWHRVIFVDMMGRKSFLAKPESSRSLAATALKSKRRYIFFISISGQDSNDGDPFQVLMRADKNASSSLTSVLHLKSSRGKAALRQLTIDSNG